MKTIFYEPNLQVCMHGVHLYVNDRRWGFYRKDDRTIVAHRRRVEVFRKEFGFYVPKFFLAYKVIFEVKTNKGYSQWTYDYKLHQRMLDTDPLVFISVARLIHNPAAEHIVRPRIRS